MKFNGWPAKETEEVVAIFLKCRKLLRVVVFSDQHRFVEFLEL